jgi:putative ABC transport system permease protein
MGIQWTLARRYLSGRKLRTFLTTLAIVFGVLVIFGMNTIMPAFVAAFRANALAVAGQTDVTITGRTSEPFSGDLVNTVAGIEGVRAVSGRLERTINLQADYFDQDPALADAVSAVGLIGIVPEAERAVRGFQVVDGRFLQEGDGAAALISQSLADAANVGLNDTLTLPAATGAVDLTIVGLMPTRLLPGNEQVFVPLSEAQKVLNMPGQINVVDANFDTAESARRDEIQNEIETALGDHYKIGALASGSELLANIQLGATIFNVIAVLGLLMGGFIIFNTFRTIVAERRHDIGMLRAVGANRRTITGIILAEGIIQGVVGTAVGLLLGYVFGVVILKAISPIYRQFININLGGPQVTIGLVLGSIALGVGVTLLAGWLPARSAGRVTPLEALRPSVAEVSLRRMAGFGFWGGVALIAIGVIALISRNSTFITAGGLLFIIGLVLIAPALVQPIALLFGKLLALLFARDGTAQLAEGNLSRQPTRAAVTASTTMIALAILVTAASMVSSIFLGFTGVLERSLGSDFLIVPPSLGVWSSNVGASPELADDLRAVDGVEVVSTLRYAATEINDTPVGLLGIEPVAYTETSGLTFTEGDAETAYREMNDGRGLIMNGIGATTAGVTLGDTVTLLTPTGEQEYTIVGLATDYLNAKTVTGYISQENITNDFGQTEDVFIQANVRPDADQAAVQAQFKELLRPYPQFKLISGQEFLEQNESTLNAAFSGMYALMIFLAIPSLIATVNTLAIGVIERTREIGMLRAVGATRGQIRKTILSEALILAAIGTAFGLLSGLYIGYLTAQAIAELGFPIVYTFPASGIIAGIAIGLLFGALAAIIPARQAAGMNVVEALRYE